MSTRHATRHPAPHPPVPPTNQGVAAALEEVADLLEEQHANQYRVQAYRTGAHTIRELQDPVALILDQQGLEGLDQLPGIGPALARAVRELLHTGRLGMLDRLQGEHDPVALLAGVPGIGPALAHRLHDEHGIDTLEELERAAHDGRLDRVAGFGPKRVAGIVDALAGRFGRRRRARHDETLPPVAELLDVDREYRARAKAGTLVRIAPRRFNPGGEAWLPVLHTTRGHRDYTALFSNTPLAHRVDRTRDWVVIFFDGDEGDRQCTVVTERLGELAGRRVVRGREDECLTLYRELPDELPGVALPEHGAPLAGTPDALRRPAGARRR